jgi:L-alanine-DL-glutamate epimerase-like enolase superfamily enzyme
MREGALPIALRAIIADAKPSDRPNEAAMKITGVRTGIVNLPADEPLAGAAANPSGRRPIVWLRLETDAGAEGLGVAYFGGALTGTLRHAIADLGALLVGDDPQSTEGVHARLKAAAGGSAGPGGIYNLALSALDIAVWDLKAKAVDQPLWKLLGGARERVPTYASGALMRELSLDRVVKAAATLKEKGWREMKTQLALPGETNPRIEVERMVRIREAIGPDIKLMCDINQRWRPEQAIDIGRRVEDAGVGLFWLEDVTTADDYAGLARVSDALATPVAGGEYVWGIVPFRHMMEARSVDVPMVDLVRVGGITQWLKVAGMAEAFNLPVVSHLIPEVHVHLIGAVPNGLTVEYMPWLGAMFKEVPVQQNGELAMPQKPGLGLEFDQAALDRYNAG